MQKVQKLLVGLQLVLILLLATPFTSCSRSQESDLASRGQIYTVAASNAPSKDQDGISGSRKNAITVAVAKASPAIVGINVTEMREQRIWNPFADDPFFRQFFGNRGSGNGVQHYEVKELGSGFLISADGYILTNDHVAGNATKIIVTLSGGVKYDAKLVATDHNGDVSLLKIEGDNLPYLKLGNSDDLTVGEWAIAMGNPFGLFSSNNKPTVTVGVISNIGVSLGLEEGRNYRDMLQTDAAISSGNSGGPLLNANGEVIGINSTIYSTALGNNGAGSIGLGFAIPINKVKKLLDGFRSGQKINRNIGNMGFRISELTEDAKEYFHLHEDDGIVVYEIDRNSVADRAGLQVGDVIVGMDNQQVRGPQDYQSILADHQVGDQIAFKLLRNQKEKEVELTLPGK